MAKLTRTWWGTNFMDALHNFMEENRLRRGRSYCNDHRILSFAINGSNIKATIRGNANAYYGIYKEPKYKISLNFTEISEKKWPKIIDKISNNVGLMSKLILNEMPDNIEDIFLESNENFLPKKSKDISSDCSCPDWENPCKHIAGVYFKVASLLDRDPFLMFDLRGMSKNKLQDSLKNSKLGKALISNLSKEKIEVPVSNSYYTDVKLDDFDESTSLLRFWNGSKASKLFGDNDNLLDKQEVVDLKKHKNGNEELDHIDYQYYKQNDKINDNISAILIKKESDYPAFWHRDNSFINAMEDVYSYIRKKNKFN